MQIKILACDSNRYCNCKMICGIQHNKQPAIRDSKSKYYGIYDYRIKDTNIKTISILADITKYKWPLPLGNGQ